MSLVGLPLGTIGVAPETACGRVRSLEVVARHAGRCFKRHLGPSARKGGYRDEPAQPHTAGLAADVTPYRPAAS